MTSDVLKRFPRSRTGWLTPPPRRADAVVPVQAALLDLTAIPDTGFQPQGPESPWARLAARAVDMAVSLVGLVLAAPVMAAVAAAVRLDSPGPAIYRQVRLGLDGAPFTLLKFRGMRVDAEAAGPVWASLRDPRVTRVGGVLRATRLDELPQLWNVLKGDMSLIGPRPERPHFVEQLASEIPHFRARMVVKPGLTGWAQVNFRYGASVEDARTKLAYDLFYVQNRGPGMYLRILLGTVGVMVRGEGR